MADTTDYLLEAALGALAGGNKAYQRKIDLEDQDALMRKKADIEQGQWKERTNIEQANKLEFEKSRPRRVLKYDEKGKPMTDEFGNFIYDEFIGAPPTQLKMPQEDKSANELKEFEAKENIKADVAERKAREKKQVDLAATKPKARKSLTGTLQGLNEIETKIDKLLNDKELFSGTGWDTYVKRWPGSKVKEIENLVDSIKAGISLDSLTELRANSPTGGALGNVSDAEGTRLENKRAKLDQKAGDKIFRSALIDLKNSIRASKQNFTNGYENDFGEPFETKGLKPLGQKKNPSEMTNDEILKALEQ